MSANDAQIELWNDRAGQRWVIADGFLVEMLAPISAVLLERTAPQPGERVLDVGCGAGQTTVDVARLVGPTGSVLGVDISAPLLGLARERRGELAHVTYVLADAQTHAFAPASFDLALSRFGVMFFADPVAAFANLGNATVAGGRLGFACWRSMIENPWFSEPLAAIAAHVEPPPRPEPGAPGPFAFADAERVRDILAGAGWRSIAIEPVDLEVKLGADPDDALRFASEVGPTSLPLADAPPDARAQALASMHSIYTRAHGENGVTMRAAIWLVTASR
jgi:SAM-dependent methyltransferase